MVCTRWKLRITRNRLHPRGPASCPPRLPSLLTRPPGSTAVTAFIRGCVVAFTSNGLPACALVQSPPLRAIWYCIIRPVATLGRITDNGGLTGPGKQFRSPRRSLISLRRPGGAGRPCKPAVPHAHLLFICWSQSKPHPGPSHDFIVRATVGLQGRHSSYLC